MNWVGKKATQLFGMLTKVTESLSSKKRELEKQYDEDETITGIDLYDYQNTYNWNTMYTNAITNTTNNGTYTISSIASGTTSIPTGLTFSGSLSNTTSTTSISNSYLSGSDVIIKREGRPDVRVGYTFDLIIEHLGLILPDQRLLEDNPSLKLAYENYREELTKSIRPPELQEAIDSYYMIEKLVKEPPEE